MDFEGEIVNVSGDLFHLFMNYDQKTPNGFSSNITCCLVIKLYLMSGLPLRGSTSRSSKSFLNEPIQYRQVVHRRAGKDDD